MQIQQISRDGKDQRFVDFANCRATLVDHREEPDKDWAGTGFYLRITAYTEDRKPMQGAEFPLTDENVLDAIRAIACVAGIAAQERHVVAA
jgi:hypothetical protein